MSGDDALSAAATLAAKRVKHPEQLQRWVEALERREGESATARDARLDEAWRAIYGGLRPKKRPYIPAVQQQLQYDDEVPF